MGSLGQLIVSLGIDVSGLDTGASAIEARLSQVGTRLYFLGSRIAAAFGVPLMGAVAAIADIGGSFDQSMTEALAIMTDVTPKLRAQMEQQAMDITKNTKFSATEGAKAYYDLASAGLNAVDSMKALPVVAQFAQAGMLDLAKAAEWLAGSQAALGLHTDNAAQNLYNMGHIADVLTMINNKAIGTVKDFASALTTNAARAMALYGVSLETGVATLGVFAQQHILGNRAGQLLYMTLRDLTSAAVKHKEEFAKAGISVFDANGQMRNMADIADDLTKKFGPMSTEGRRAEMQFLGLTSRSQQGINALIGMGDELRSLEHDLHNAGGTTQEVAEKQMQSFFAQMTKIGNQIKVVAIQIFSEFVPAFKQYFVPWIEKGIDVLRQAADWLNKTESSTKAWIMALVGLGIALGPVIMAVSGFTLVLSTLASIGKLTTGLMSLSTAARAVAAVMPSAAAATTAAGTATAMTATALMGAIAFWGAIVIAIGGAIYAAKEMVGGWSRLGDVLNAVTGGGFHAVTDALGWMWSKVTSNKQAVFDFAQALEGGLYYAFVQAKAGLNQLADYGEKVHASWTSLMGVCGYFIQLMINFGHAVSSVNNFFRDHIPLVASMEDWIGNRLSSAVGWVGKKYDELIKSGKEWRELMLDHIPAINEQTSAYKRMEESLKGIHMWILKNQAVQLPTSAPLPGGMTMEEYIEKWLGPMPKYTPPDEKDKTSKKQQNRTGGIFDEISGKRALQDAADWQKAIEQLGGASLLAETDITRAIKVYGDAIDRLEKLGLANADVTKTYKGMRDALIYSSDEFKKVLDAAHKAEGGFNAMGLSMTSVGAGMEKADPELVKMLQHMTDIELKGKTTSQLGPEMFPGYVAASTLRGEYANWIKKDTEYAAAMKRVQTGFSQMGSEFGRLGTMIGGSAGEFLKGISQVSIEMKAAGESGTMLKNGLHDIGKGGKVAMAGMMEAAQGAVQAAGAFMAATDNASMAKNVLGGAAVGAKVGAQFAGAWGAAVGAGIGAIAALIKGKPQWAKTAEEIGTEMGVKISDKLAKAIVDKKKDFGGSIQASVIDSLKSIIGEAGGLGIANIDKFLPKLHDVFSMIETHQMTITQGTKVLDENWKSFAEAGTDSLGFISDKLVEIIKLNDKFGTQSKEIADYLKAQLNSVAEGFNAVAIGGMGPLNDSIDKVKDNIDLMKAATTNGQVEFDRLGRLAQVAFGAAVKSGKSLIEAVDAIGPGLDALAKGADNFGFHQTEAFGKLIEIRAFTQANKDLVGELDGVNKMIVGLANSGVLTQSSFSDLGAEAASVFQRMVDKGMDSNTALMMMQPTLQTLWEAQHKFGFNVDEGTQALLDQAAEIGMVGETHKSVNDQMLDQLSQLNKTMSDFVSFLSGGVTGAFTGLGTASTGVMSTLKGQIQEVANTRIDINVHGHWDMDDTPHMAGGGILTSARHVVVGEAGPEAVIPLTQLKGMLGGSTNTNDGSQMMTVVLELDGVQITKKVLQYMPDELRRNGLFT